MNFLKLFFGLYFVAAFLINLHSNNEILHISLASLRSSEKLTATRKNKLLCREFAQEYLDYLYLKNDFFYRVKITTTRYKLLVSESDPELASKLKQGYEDSHSKMVQVSNKLDSNLERANRLFNELMLCFEIFGVEFSPNNIFETNKSNLKHLTSVDSLLK